MIPLSKDNEINATTDIFLIEQQEDFSPEFGYYIKESWIKTMGFQGAFLYAFLSSLSHQKGYCWIQTKNISPRLGLCEKSIENHIRVLEEKGFIFRNTFNTSRGKIRHIVTTDNCKRYWDEFLNKDSVPQNVKDNFMKFFTTTIPTPTPPPPILTPPPSSSTPTSLANGNIFPNDTQRKDSSVAKHQKNSSVAYLQKYYNKSITATVPPLSEEVVFREQLIHELSSSGILGERLDHAMQYFDAHKSQIMKKNSPIGFMKWSSSQGLAADEYNKKKIKQEEVLDKEATIRKNKDFASRIYREMENHKILRFTKDEFSCRVSHDGNVVGMFSYADPNLQTNLEYIFNKFNRSKND
jgi:hypothetical protein